MHLSESPSDAGSRNQGNQNGATLFLRAGISGDLDGGANSRAKARPPAQLVRGAFSFFRSDDDRQPVLHIR